jgi:type II secretory pathway component PulF
MPWFQYKAVQNDGKSATGEMEASGRQEAFRLMEERGLKPISLKEKASGSGPAKNGNGRNGGGVNSPSNSSGKESASKNTGNASGNGNSSPNATSGAKKFSFGFQSTKITARMLENFTRLLSSLLAAGVPLSRALVILCREAASPAAGAQWKQVHAAVIDGVSLADAMSQSPQTFPRVYVAMVEAGETGGFLDVVLAQIAEFQSREKEIRSKVTAAMMYPVILFFLAMAVLIFLMVFFIPRFQTIFTGFGGELPLLTRGIIATSHAMIHYGLWVAIALGVVGLLVRTWLVSEKGRRVWEGFILRAPVIGPLVGQFAMARFCRMLGTLLGAGVPLVQGLNVARKSIGNQILVDAVSNAIDRVKEGGQLGKSLGECRDLFNGSILEMISVAEESGRLDQELIRIAAVTEGDLDRQLKSAVSLAEPLMLFLIAGFIGTIFIGMVVPIFSLQDHIK